MAEAPAARARPAAGTASSSDPVGTREVERGDVASTGLTGALLAHGAVRVLAVGADDPRHAALVRAAEAELVRRYGDGALEPPEAHDEPDPAHLVHLLAVLDAGDGADGTPGAPGVPGARDEGVVGGDGHPLGCVVLAPRPAAGPGVGEVKRLFVPPEARRRGVAAALLAAVRGAARAQGYDVLHLVTGTLQPEAIALYEREGWRPIPPYAWADDPMTRCFALPLT